MSAQESSRTVSSRDQQPNAQQPNAQQPPGWAVDQASDELYDSQDPGAIAERAWELAREAQEREDERHDEYDDPDQGGEA